MTTTIHFKNKKRDEYNLMRDHICERQGISIAQYNWFRLRANKLHKHYENDCNGYQDAFGNWSEKLEIIAEKQELALETEIEEQAKKLGLYVYFQRDPRGGTIYLSKEPIADNNYNRFGSDLIW